MKLYRTMRTAFWALRRNPLRAGLTTLGIVIGVAEADLFPRFTISGAFGFQSNRAHTWFDSVNNFWSFGPGVSWQLFTTGRVLSNIKLQKALTEESFLAYEQTVLTALQQVENALVIATKEEERHKALADAVSSNRKALELATQLYAQGQTDFLNVLQAQGGPLCDRGRLGAEYARPLGQPGEPLPGVRRWLERGARSGRPSREVTEPNLSAGGSTKAP